MALSKPATRLALFGAAPDTPNMGVSALFWSAVAGLSRYFDSVEFVVFDNALGRREVTVRTPGGEDVRLIRFGARGGRRYHRPENLVNMSLTSRLGKSGAYLNEGIRLVDSCVAVLDVSAGDSFSDIYGRERFDLIYRPKAIAINRGKPLILLPQTYGPYTDPGVRAKTVSALHQARMAWARDPDSYDALKGLLGDSFDPRQHICGVDMAFGLPPSPAREQLDTKLNDWLGARSADRPLLGFNVSGLIYNDPAGAMKRYQLKADYRQTVVGFLTAVMAMTSARLVLVSHVMAPPGHYESDLAACHDVAKQLGPQYASRVAVVPATLDQSQAKWLIAQMDWFCGTRMHSTIAGLSSGVSTAAISYSDKTRGVFETCGQAAQVMDPRRMSAAEIERGLMRSFEDRDRTKCSLHEKIPGVMRSVAAQMQITAAQIESLAG